MNRPSFESLRRPAEIEAENLGPTLAIAAAGTLAALVAYTGPLGNLPTLAGALHAGATGRTWILSSMSVALAASLLTLGAIADDYGRRRVFVAGCLLLATGSLVGSVSTATGPFLVGRFAAGIGGAAVIASSLGLVARLTRTPRERGLTSGVWGASVGAGIAVGPVATGALDEAHAWRAFYVLLAVATVILAGVGRRVLTESVAGAHRSVDGAGAVALAACLVLGLVALTEGRNGIGPLVGWTAAGAVVAAVVFVRVESRPAAMLDLRLFRHPAFATATLAALGTGISLIGVMSIAGTFFITALHLSALHSALLLLAWSGTSAVSALLARLVPAGLGGPRQLALSLAGVAAGELLMIGQGGAAWWRLVPGLVVTGVASGVLNAGLARAAVGSVPAGRASLGSGANNTARYVGSSIGVTVVVLVAGRLDGGGGRAFTGWNAALAVSAGAAVITAAAVVALAGKRRPTGSGGRSLASERPVPVTGRTSPS